MIRIDIRRIAVFCKRTYIKQILEAVQCGLITAEEAKAYLARV